MTHKGNQADVVLEEKRNRLGVSSSSGKAILRYEASPVGLRRKRRSSGEILGRLHLEQKRHGTF